MRRLRCAAVLAVGFTLGAALVASPGWAAEPSNGARPDVVNSAADVVAGQTVAKDDQGRTLVYVEGEQESALRAAVSKAGGVVADSDVGRVKAAVPGDKLDEVAAQAGVTEVRRPDRAVPMAVTSEGVGLSKANLWIQNGQKGAGVKVGVIDVGFGGLAQTQAAGELPPTGPQLTVNNTNCLDATLKTDHGTNVAEVVHDMAPQASLYLACIEDTVSFSAAADWLRQQGVQVITAAVGFLSPTGGRGDGTGPLDSPADVVKRSREAGIMWSVATGNQARLHFAGPAPDRNGNGWVEFDGTAENNGFTVQSGATTTIGLRWDAWPTTNEDLDLYVMSQQHRPNGPNDPDLRAVSTRSQKDTVGGLSPTEEVTFVNNDAVTRPFYVYVKNSGARFTTRFDLFVNGPSGQLQYFTEAGSVTEPATSPYVMAVGATEPGSGAVEDYSGRGPTIDGRQKPDITGFDKVTTSTWGTQGFAGTSAAAAHVAGAAAVLKSANPALDATQLQSALQSKASPRKSDNNWGSGVLNLGTPDTVPTETSYGYTPLSQPKRLLNTNDATGGHQRQFTEGEVFVLPTGAPAGTKAVTVTINGFADALATSIDLFPAAPPPSSRTSHLRLSAGQYGSLTLVVPLGDDRAIRIRNKSGKAHVILELLGYFDPTGASTYFSKASPTRVLDTRGPSAGMADSPKVGHLGAGEVQALQIHGVAGVPRDATAVVVNLTALESTLTTSVTAFGRDYPGTFTLQAVPNQRRSNMTIVPIAEDGKIRLRNEVGVANLVVDVTGWFAPGTGGRFVPFSEANRIVDTTVGTGVRQGPVAAGDTVTAQVRGLAGVSDSATTAVLTVAGTEDSIGTELSVTAARASAAAVTAVSVDQRQPGTNTVFSALSTDGRVDLTNDRGSAHLAVDVAGYFVGTPAPAPESCSYPKGDLGYTGVLDGRMESNSTAWITVGGTTPQVGDCAFVTATGPGVTWYPVRTYRNDYTVKLDWKDTSGQADSGVFVGFPHPHDDATVPGTKGVEVQISSTGTGTAATGGIVGLHAPTAQAAKAKGEWNTFEITLAGNRVTVLLNGIQVNEYTITDPGRIHENTFIGLQNSNTSQPVSFRNVRIKRNGPLAARAMVGLNDKCLDVPGGDVNSSTIRLWTCNGTPAQMMTTQSDGTLHAFGRCLDVLGKGTANDTAVILSECNAGSNQQWIIRSDDTIYSLSAAKCLTAISGDDDARMVVRDCSGQPQQRWRTGADSGREGLLTTVAGGRCLDIPFAALNGDLATANCNGHYVQTWTMNSGGTLRNMGNCVGTASAGTAVGVTVGLWPCNGAADQQWVLNPNKTLVNPVSGRCLTPVSGDAVARLTIQDCTDGTHQQWILKTNPLTTGQIIGYQGRCLRVTDFPANPGIVRANTDCAAGSLETWSRPGNGSVGSVGRCLDNQAAGTNDLNPAVLYDCNGTPAQQWVPRPNGALVNPLSDKCLDAGGAGFSTLIYGCHSGTNQRWALQARPS